MPIKLKTKACVLIAIAILASPLLIPQRMTNPVIGADNDSWNHDTFWHYPWGASVVHKGIDIFAPVGTPVTSPQRGIVIYRDEIERGGKVVAILGPLLRIHYFAHLNSFNADLGLFVSKGDTIGCVGTTGNAAGGPPHLHYAILTPIPYPWRWSGEKQGFRRMFYLDPGEKILNASRL